MPPSVSGSYNYRETIAFSMVEAVQAINPPNVAEKNELVRMLLTGNHTDTTEADFKKFMGNTEEFMKAEAGGVSKPILNRSKPGRLSGMCYRNAIAEYYETKNPIVIGWEGVLAGDGYLTVMPHAFNYDKKRKCYYDTACNYKKGDNRRAVWPLVDGDAALARLQTSENFAETWGGFVFILWKGEAYNIRAYGLSGDGTRRVSLQSKMPL